MSVINDFELLAGFGHDLFVLLFAVAGLFYFWVGNFVSSWDFLSSLYVAVHVFHKQLGVQGFPALERALGSRVRVVGQEDDGLFLALLEQIFG